MIFYRMMYKIVSYCNKTIIIPSIIVIIVSQSIHDEYGIWGFYPKRTISELL
jgi:hypothetical protein